MQGGHYYPGVGGYVAGDTSGYVVGVGYPRVVGAAVAPHAPHPGPPGAALIRVRPDHPLHPLNRHHHMRHHEPHFFPAPFPEGALHGYPIHRPPWRDMNAPGSPPLGEGHVPMPLTPETFNGTWGTGVGGAAPGVVITFSARPQKPYKTTRLLVSGTKVGSSAVGRLVGQTFVGTDLQQGELGFMDLETMGAGGSFDTWVSFKQAEPGVWIRVQATLTAFPTGNDYEVYTVTGMGHYLH
jgi:hypothetical protein